MGKATWKINRDSYSKCVVYFKDGNSRTFYSIDWIHQYSKNRDPEIGLSRLRKLIKKYGNNATVAIIYDLASNKKVDTYLEGVKKE